MSLLLSQLRMPIAIGDDEDMLSARLSASLSVSGPTCTLTLQGSLDAGSAIAVLVHIEQIRSGGFSTVIVDTSGVTGMDPCGRAALLALQVAIAEYGGRAVIHDGGMPTVP